MRRQVDLSDALSAAFKFGIEGVGPLLRLGWLPLLVVTVGSFLLLDAGATFSSMSGLAGDGTIRLGWGGRADFEEVTKPIQAVIGALVVLGGLVGFVPVYVGLLREAATQTRDSGRWRFDGRAWRMIGASLLLGFVMIVGVVVLMLPFLAVSSLAEGEMGGLGTLGFVVAGVLAFACFVFVYVRLVLFVPLAATENRVSFGEAWAATRDQFWTIFAGLIVVGLGTAIIGAILEVVGVSLGSVFEVIGPTWAGPGLVAVGGILSQVFQNLVSIGFAGRVVHDLRGYGEGDTGEGPA